MANYYVATTGDNGGAGTIGDPWETVSYGVAHTPAGSTLYIRGGTYSEQVVVSNSGFTIINYGSEVATIDGAGMTIPAHESFNVLVNITGSDIIWDGVNVVDSGEYGIFTWGDRITLRNFECTGVWKTAVALHGTDNIAEYLDVNNTSMNNFEGANTDQWGAALTASRRPTNAIIRHCLCWHNWGEGISTYEAFNTTIEDNITFGNYSVNLYVSDCDTALVQRNLVYSDGYTAAYQDATGIGIWNETYDPMNQDVTIINNIVYGCNRNVRWGPGSLGADYGGMVRIRIENNTFMNASQYYNAWFVDSPHHEDSIFRNNIIIQEDSLPLIYCIDNAGFDISYNCWNKDPGSEVTGTGNIIDDPEITKTDAYDNALYYKLQATSPCIGEAYYSSDITDDYFGLSRGGVHDIGASEYADSGESSSVSPSLSPSFSPSSSVSRSASRSLSPSHSASPSPSSSVSPSVSPSTSSGFPTTGILDNFNRTNANPLDGNWTNGWWGDSNPQISSNLVIGVVDVYAGSYYNGATYGPDAEAYATITGLTTWSSIHIGLRIGGTLTAPNGYAVKYDNNAHTVVIRRLTSGSPTDLGASIACTLASGDKLGISATGSTITAYQYTGGVWAELGNRTDVTYADAGYLAFDIENNTLFMDDFGGGTAEAGPSSSVSPSASKSLSPSSSISPSQSKSVSPSTSRSLSPSSSVSPSVSPSTSRSLSPSSSVSPSQSRSISPSVSPSASRSLSPSSSISPSVSPSASRSLSPSSSVSPSQSKSTSPSVSPSTSRSLSPSSSVSPSNSRSISPSFSVSSSASASNSRSLSPSSSTSPSNSPSISPSNSPSVSPSVSKSASPSLSPSSSVSPSESRSLSPSSSPSLPNDIIGSVTWGHQTGVIENNALSFSNNWWGTSIISGVGDSEIMIFETGQYSESGVINTGIEQVELLMNNYSVGDNVILKYKNGNSKANCLLDTWTTYTVPFTSLGFVQVRLEKE